MAGGGLAASRVGWHATLRDAVEGRHACSMGDSADLFSMAYFRLITTS